MLTRSSGSSGNLWEDDPEPPRGVWKRIADRAGPPFPIGPVGWAASLPRIDIALPWLEPAWEAAVRLIQGSSPEVVLITMSPFDLCFLGRRIRDELGLPVVYDLRDPWALDGWRLRGSRLSGAGISRSMSEALIQCEGVIANTPEAEKVFLREIPGLSPERVVTIPNGFDAEDFASPLESHRAREADTAFRLVHSGTFHCGNLYRYRGPLGWLKRARHYRPEPIDPFGKDSTSPPRGRSYPSSTGLPAGIPARGHLHWPGGRIHQTVRP